MYKREKNDDKNASKEKIQLKKKIYFSMLLASLFFFCNFPFFSQASKRITVLSWLQCGCGFKLQEERRKEMRLKSIEDRIWKLENSLISSFSSPSIFLDFMLYRVIESIYFHRCCVCHPIFIPHNFLVHDVHILCVELYIFSYTFFIINVLVECVCMLTRKYGRNSSSNI